MMPMTDSLRSAYKDLITIVKISVGAINKPEKELMLATGPGMVIYKDGRQLCSHDGLVK